MKKLIKYTFLKILFISYQNYATIKLLTIIDFLLQDKKKTLF